MVGLHLLKHPDIFYPYIKEDLGDQSYVSYCRNIYEGNVWGDDVMLAAIGHMWNISITVICLTVILSICFMITMTIWT